MDMGVDVSNEVRVTNINIHIHINTIINIDNNSAHVGARGFTPDNAAVSSYKGACPRYTSDY